jgi:hypothetical protein
VSYSIFKSCPSATKALVAVINRAITEEHVPKCWKEGKIVLIYKKGPAEEPANYRPICLSNAASKIFTTYLQKHIDAHMTMNKLWSPTQKGFREHMSGCIEHQFMLQKLIEHVRRTGQSDLIVILTDLADAFGSVRHSLIHFVTKYYGIDPKLRQVIASLYKDLEVSLELDGTTVQIRQEKGVFQGDCLSPTLFNMVINIILARLNKAQVVEKYGATVNKKSRISNTAFADDVTLMARSPESANQLLALFEDCLSWTKCLKAAPHKFITRHYSKKEVLPTIFKFQDQELPTSCEGSLKMLGRKFWPSVSTQELETECEEGMKKLLDAIDAADVPTIIKLDMAQKFLHVYLRWNLTVYPPN